MKFERQFNLPAWDEHVASLACDYIRTRDFKDAQLGKSESGGVIVVGTRGSLLGNLMSFDMRKLRARIRVAPDTSGRVTVELDIDTAGQQITEWNSAFWRLELIELCSVLRQRGPIDDVWQQYELGGRKAAILWTLSLTLAGQHLTHALKLEIGKLEESMFPSGPA